MVTVRKGSLGTRSSKTSTRPVTIKVDKTEAKYPDSKFNKHKVNKRGA